MTKATASEIEVAIPSGEPDAAARARWIDEKKSGEVECSAADDSGES